MAAEGGVEGAAAAAGVLGRVKSGEERARLARVSAAARVALNATRSHSGGGSASAALAEGALAAIETIANSLDTLAAQCGALEEEGRGNAKVSAALQKYSAEDAADAAAVAEAQARLAESVRAVCAAADTHTARDDDVTDTRGVAEVYGGVALGDAAADLQTPLESLVTLCDELVGLPSREMDMPVPGASL